MHGKKTNKQNLEVGKTLAIYRMLSKYGIAEDICSNSIDKPSPSTIHFGRRWKIQEYSKVWSMKYISDTWQL
jgi:hypothetical protein